MNFKNSTLILALLLLTACGSESTGINTEQAVLQGSRILGMDVKQTPSVTYALAYKQATDMGVREVSISLDWSILEPTVGHYDNSLPAIIDAFFPLQAGDITLVLRPLDTPGARMPSDLAGLTFDDPAVISAFDNFLVNLHSQLSTLNASGKLKWIHLGNEVDAYLGTNNLLWQQWQTFFRAAKSRIKTLWGSTIQVSSIVQFSALKNSAVHALYLNLLPDLDIAAITYYPLNADFSMRPPSTVSTDFAFMVDHIPLKNLLLQECGYPSSVLNNSSERLQADFISAVFNAWDTHKDRITLIDFAWQYDVSPATVDQWVIDFGLSGHPDENRFRSYLGTLGFNRYDSIEKMASQRLRDELKTRLWVQ